MKNQRSGTLTRAIIVLPLMRFSNEFLIMNRNSSRPYDVVELSPTGKARCRACKKNIEKGHCRIGVHKFLYHRNVWGKQFYHRECLEATASVKNSLYLSPVRAGTATSLRDRIEMELQKATEDRAKRTQTVHQEHGDLRELLRQMRLCIARRLNVAPYIVFHNTVLDSIVEHQPSTRAELLRIKGIGPNKFDDFGAIILNVVALYKLASGGNASMSLFRPATSLFGSMPTASTTTVAVENTESSSDEICVEKEMTVGEIVDQKFKEAEENGTMIEL